MAKEKIKEEVEEKKQERFILVEVPTQVGIFIKDNKTEKIFDDKTALLLILNKLDKIEKTL